MGKSIWQSKTFWANVLGAGLAVMNGPTGAYLPPQYLAVILTGMNLALRAVTAEPIKFSD